jgi:hypothetical protein
LAAKMQGIANPCIFRTFYSYMNAYKPQMDNLWCHWKEDEISYKLEGKFKFENRKISIRKLQLMI